MDIRWRCNQLVLENVRKLRIILHKGLSLTCDKYSFEVQVGIIAACIPALRHGYLWLVDVKKRHSSKGHLELSDQVRLRPLERGTPTYTANARKSSEGLDSSIDLENGNPNSSHQIKKTVRVDLN